MGRKLNTWFWIISLFHVVIWTLLPTLIRYALPMDANEGYMWGTYLDFGYDRDPWLNAWLTRFAVDIGGRSGWLVYGLSQLSVVLAFWSVWVLGRRFLEPVYAFMAVFLLEGIQYYHLAAIDFNDNVLELGLWSLMALTFYRALIDQKKRFWFLFGVVSGLGLMAKYYTVFPLCCMLLFLHHDFSTIRYTQQRVNLDQSAWFAPVVMAFRFLFIQLGAFFGGVLLCIPLLLNKVPAGDVMPSMKANKLGSFHQAFLLWVGVGPLLLTVLFLVAVGGRVYIMWGTPTLSLFGIVLFWFWKPVITPKRLNIFIMTVLVVLSAFAAGYAWSLTRMGNDSSANEPAQAIVKAVERVWFQYTSKPLYYVAGDRYLASYAVYYSHHHPKAFVEYSLMSSPWIDTHHLHNKGAVFLHRIDPGYPVAFPAEVLLQYPQLKVLPVQHFEYHRSEQGQQTLDVLMGILLPEGQRE
jgi:4-amino-4-deoxy-L-arabinose transferase-like glycosyltransferase